MGQDSGDDAGVVKPAPFSNEALSQRAPAFSEESIALLFAEKHADKLRYVSKWGVWLIWDGTCWRFDEKRKVFTLARELCRRIALTANKPKEQKTIASAKCRAAVVALAGEDPRLAASVDQWDTDIWALNTPGGVVDLQTGKMRPHEMMDYMTKQTSVTPEGKCPRWKKFLNEVTGGDSELQKYLQRVAGYCLTGSTREQQLFFFYGSGENGKGTWVRAMSGVLKDYHRSAPIETFTASHNDRHPTDLAGLMGARLVTASETEDGRRWSEARIKELTGGDEISARFMRQDFFDFTPVFKLLFSGNHMPALRSVNRAITRRFNRIPFTVTIAKVNKNLDAELKEEWPGILAWAIEGCLQWQQIGLEPPAAVTDATASYLESQDILGEWLDETCERNANAWVSSVDLFISWQVWAADREEWIGSVKTLSSKLEDRGEFRSGRNKEKTKRGFYGLRLREGGTKDFFKPEPASKGVKVSPARRA